MVGYGMMVLLFGGGLFAFIIRTMFFISWQLTLISFIPMIFLIVSTYFWVESRRIMLSKTGKQSLSWMMKSWSPSKGFGSWGPIVNGTSRSTVSEENSQSIQNRGQNCFYPHSLALSPVVYWILGQSWSCYLEDSPKVSWAVEPWQVIGLYSCILVSLNWAYEGRTKNGGGQRFQR